MEKWDEDMNLQDHPRALEILVIVDYYSWACTNAMKELIKPDKRSGLDRMIDKVTGYDKAQHEQQLKDLKSLIIALKSKAKFEQMIEHENLPMTIDILQKIKEYRDGLDGMQNKKSL